MMIGFAETRKGGKMDDFEKLINASDLTEWIIETCPEWCEGAIRTIVDHIDEMPSAQQEEIIRCKDCKHYKAYYYTGCLACHLVEGRTVRRDLDDFCSRAERRDE